VLTALIAARLIYSADIELAPLTRVIAGLRWVDLTQVRRYQQETYTSNLRMRRGPSRPETRYLPNG
jgi:hypothetical protein